MNVSLYTIFSCSLDFATLSKLSVKLSAEISQSVSSLSECNSSGINVTDSMALPLTNISGVMHSGTSSLTAPSLSASRNAIGRLLTRCIASYTMNSKSEYDNTLLPIVENINFFTILMHVSTNPPNSCFPL